MNPSDLPLAVQLTMPPDTQATLRQHEGAVEVAHAYEIDSPDMAVAANDELKLIKGSLRELETLRKGFIAPAMQIVENARTLFNPAILALEQAEGILKGKLLEFQKGEQRKADEAKRAREDEERKLRQEADRLAAIERARADERAREARRKAQEAEAARQKAEAEGNARAAAAAAAAAAKANAFAQAHIENGEAKAQAAQLQAAAMPASAPLPEPTKLAGFSMRKDWRAFLPENTTEEQTINQIAAALPTRPELGALLCLDWSVANKMAKALETRFNVPGLKAENVPQAASSRR